MKIKSKTIWRCGLVFSVVSLTGQVGVYGPERLFINLIAAVVIVFLFGKVKGGQK